jgi:hypothetical protein
MSTQTGAYTLTLADRFSRLSKTDATPNTVTIPPHSSVKFRVGDWVDVCQMGIGITTIVQGSGVTVLAPAGVLQLNSQYATVRLIQVSLDTWVIDRGIVGQAPSGGANPDPSIVAQTSTDSGITAVTTHIINFTAATAGSDLFVAFRGGAVSNAPSSPTAGWTLVKEAYGGSSSVGIHIYSKLNCAGGETSFQYTTAGGEATAMQHWEVSGLLSHAVDKVPAAVDNTSNAAATTLHMTTTGQLTAAKEFVLFAVSVSSSTPANTTCDESFQVRNAATQFRMQCADVITVDTTAKDPTLTWTGGARAIGISASFQ